MRIALSTCLAAVQYFLLSATPVQAIPTPINDAEATPNLSSRNIGAGKRIVLWEWTNTRDFASTPALRTAAARLSNSAEIKTVVNWETWRPTELPKNLYYHPMVRTLAQLSGNDWNNLLVSLTNQPNLTQKPIVHFFNEPERQNIIPQQAVQYWRSQMLPLRKNRNVELVSPAVASDSAGANWIRTFNSLLSASERPNYVGVHFYTNQNSPVDTEIAAAKNYLTSRMSDFGNANKIPLIVSEIASTSRTLADVNRFTKQVSDWMDKQQYVKQYGFFGASRVPADGFVSPQAQLLNANGAWTALGKYLGGW